MRHDGAAKLKLNSISLFPPLQGAGGIIKIISYEEIHIISSLGFLCPHRDGNAQENTSQGNPQEMDKFITELMGKMTLHEKIGQLNLPVTGNIVTGQAKSSDVAGKIRNGEVGGLFNLKGVKNIREVQKLAVENSRLGIPLLFGMDVIHGYETVFPTPFGTLVQLGHGGYREIGPYRRH